MSESPQNAEIEDVLSSIRRLVAGSEEASRRHGTETPDESVGTPRPEGGREDPFDATAPLPGDGPPQNAAPALVLTEADRVDPADDADVDAAARSPEAGATAAPLPGPARDAEADVARSERPEALFRAASARTAPDASAAPAAQAPTARSIADDEAPQDTRRQGFGFAGARRDDPVKHIPLASRAQPGSAGSASPAMGGSTSSPTDDALDEQSPGHQATSAAHTAAADEDVGGAPPREAISTADPGPTSDSNAAERPTPAVGPANAAETGASAIPPGPNRRMGPIISEAFAHPPTERASAAAPMPGESEEEAPEQLTGGVDAPVSADSGHHLEQMAAEASAADIDGEARDDPPEESAGGDEACAPPDEDREVASTPEAGGVDSSADDGASAHAAGSASEGPSSPPRDAILANPGGPDGGAATAVEGEDLRPEAPVAGDQSGGDNLFSDQLDGVDPALLRRMVRDVLREELEGEIGRRASARIRQLIRDEVRLALGAHGTD